MIRFDTKKDYELYVSIQEENIKLKKENKQLKDNWIELKNHLEKTIVDSMSCNTKQYYYEQVYKFVIELEGGD